VLQTPLETKKEILGYELQERIGAGGFGEVWSAVAPGGMKKALKVVFGYHDGKRAQAELKALDRVKELRHPFLLSLERIEIFEGQLIVVSELGDKSLADAFNESVATTSQGIDRDMMLRYMRCAAEALDYLSDSHGLQHLDIKPENLLLIGDHLKVADFGLIKDLQQASQSLMSGMTPAYAAPELFDGRPCTASDQYSLAIVYQEMITGSRPFPGTTPAQLAAQHISGRPNLNDLPKSDQPIIAKALSKDPSLRFKSCRELVEELINKKRATKKTVKRREKTGSRSGSQTSVVGSLSPACDMTQIVSEGALPFQAAEVKVLDPPICSAEDTKFQPTLIIGVGLTGNRVVEKMKAQLVARHGSMDQLPAIKLVGIDSDRDAIGEMLRRGKGGLDSSEIIETPLKKPEVYRSQDKKNSHLNWLGRRWIYNVPRTLQTEGLRPLGRLAFADHFDSIYDRLEQKVREISTPESLAQTADTLDIDPGTEKPRVFIVSSISGGIGSGMMLDLAYSVRVCLAECGVESDSISGLMLHSSYQRFRDPGLSTANTFALLTELRHYVETGYPGDSTCGLPEFEDIPPFDHTYFRDLGKDLCQSKFDEKLDRVAEYLMLSSTSKCATFFDHCRSNEVDADEFSLRTFGVSVTGPGKFAAGINATGEVSRRLMRRWKSGDENTLAQATETAKKLIQDCSLDQSRLVEKLNGLTATAMAPISGRLVGEVKAALSCENGCDERRVAAILDGNVAVPESRNGGSGDETGTCHEIRKEVSRLAPAVGEAVVSNIIQVMSGHEMNLALALTTCDQVKSRLQAAIGELEAESRQVESQEGGLLKLLVSTEKSNHRSKSKNAVSQDDLIQSYLAMRTQVSSYRFARLFYRNVISSVDSLMAMLYRFQRQLDVVVGSLQKEPIVRSGEESKQLDMEAMLNASVESRIDELVVDTERLVFESLIKQHGGYVDAMQVNSVWQNQLAEEIHSQAQRVLADAYKKTSLDEVIKQNNIEPERMAKWLNDKMQEARPELDDCGGGTRLLIGMPMLTQDDSLESMLEKQFSIDGCSIPGTEGSFVLCFEGEGLGLANVAFQLLQARPDAIELVKRIHTRCDVKWSSLSDLL
jgi:hypothetical protein